MTTLKVKGFVEIEREKFLSFGLNGAYRDAEMSGAPERLSFVLGAAKTTKDRSTWTMAGWA